MARSTGPEERRHPGGEARLEAWARSSAFSQEERRVVKARLEAWAPVERRRPGGDARGKILESRADQQERRAVKF